MSTHIMFKDKEGDAFILPREQIFLRDLNFSGERRHSVFYHDKELRLSEREFKRVSKELLKEKQVQEFDGYFREVN